MNDIHVAVVRTPLLGLMVGLCSFLISSVAFSRPEFSRYGYFSCVSCHASPSGGGALTAYGRGFAAEKLSSFTYNNAEQPLHGLVGQVPEWLISGGNIRLVQTYADTAAARSSSFFRMQADLELGAQYKGFWVVGTAGYYGPDDSKEGQKLQYRRHYARLDLGENWVVRAGKFTPRFGLMIPDHSSPVKRGIGLGQGKENDTAQVIFLSETIEASLDYFVGDQIDKELKGLESGASGNIYWAPLSDARLGIHLLSSAVDTFGAEQERQVVGASAAAKLPKDWFVMTEHDYMKLTQNGSDTRGYFSTTRFGFDMARGLLAFVKHDIYRPDVKDNAATTRYSGVGSQWFPHPHFDITAELGVQTESRTFTYANVGSLILLYYF